jgi:hypothetical protein
MRGARGGGMEDGVVRRWSRTWSWCPLWPCQAVRSRPWTLVEVGQWSLGRSGGVWGKGRDATDQSCVLTSDSGNV